MLHVISFFNIAELPVATMTWNDDHIGAACPDLLHFATAVKYTLFVIPGSQSSATSPAAGLQLPVGVQINPITDALVQDPARLFEKTMIESFQRASAVIAGIMVSRLDVQAIAIQFDAARFDILY